MEGLIMKRKLKFGPQELSAVLVEAVSTAYLTSSGIDATSSKLIGSALGSVAKGIALSPDGCADGILSSIEKAIQTVRETGQTELSNDCWELLQQDIFSPKRLIHFMYQSDSRTLLEDQILQICSENPDFDIRTFSAEQLLSEMIERVEAEVLKNHELATYVSFCILSGKLHTSPIHTANIQYVSSFKEPLFLHKHELETRVTLKNLFVLQKHQLLNNSDLPITPNQESMDLQDTISDFLKGIKWRKFLIIEGDAGSGKTSLVAWMNYHYSLQDEISAQLFGQRPLITIRLRDLDKSVISKESSLSHAILNYMNIASLDKLEELFPQAIMVLDGFDELCMIEGIGVDHDQLLYDLYSKHLDNFKFIITSRPKYINRGINLPSTWISLEHFDSKQRKIWLERYTSEEYCGQRIDETVKAYIEHIDDEDSSCICDTPMTLYMLAAKEGSQRYLNNSWSLYHHIFMEELSETEYNKMFPDPNRNYAHDINRLRHVIYQVSEEIAYYMYQQGNRSFFLSDHEISSIVTELSKNNPILKRANMKDIVERCYALCCYWKANSDRGVVEFLHNNIRDFFLAEKIYREMDAITQYTGKNITEEEAYISIARKLCTLFPHGILESKVTEFIYLRAKYQAENRQSDFSKYEYQTRMIGRILLYMNERGIVESNVLTNSHNADPVQTIINIITCTSQIYRHTYEAHIKESELIEWFAIASQGSLQLTAHNSMLVTLFRQVFSLVPVTPSYDHMITMASCGNFHGLDFHDHDLRNIGFQYSNLSHTNFSNTVLSGCDCSHANLSHADFTNADIHYACLTGAILDHCNMTGADLRGTELPDGFCSIDQSEQVAHLKSLSIPGLII